MNALPSDEKQIEELVRKIMELSGEGRPLMIGMKIVIAGPPGWIPLLTRGDTTEPEIELHEIGDRVVLTTELPGMAPEQIQVLFREDRVFIWAKNPERQYRASRKVPPATKGSAEITLRHGVLEVSYLPLAVPSAEASSWSERI